MKRYDHIITISFVSFITDDETEEMKGMVMLYGKEKVKWINILLIKIVRL